MAHTAPGGHQEKLLLGHLPHRSVPDGFNKNNVTFMSTSPLDDWGFVQADSGVLTCCGSVAASL